MRRLCSWRWSVLQEQTQMTLPSTSCAVTTPAASPGLELNTSTRYKLQWNLFKLNCFRDVFKDILYLKYCWEALSWIILSNCTALVCLQDIFECRTCGLLESLCCCTECARVCHKGHDCKWVRCHKIIWTWHLIFCINTCILLEERNPWMQCKHRC